MAQKIEPAMKRAWPGPEGLIPVTDGQISDANVRTRYALDNISFIFQMIGTEEADTTFHLWNETFASPIMLPAFSHLEKVGKDGRDPMVEYAVASVNMNLVNWVGMVEDDELLKILETGAKTIRIIKPFQNHQLILNQIAFAEEHGAFGVGIDIDHIIGKNGKYDIVDGNPMGPITFDDLKKFVQSTNLPFIAKGVLSVQDARLCYEAGVKGIVLSHHHGRLPYAISPIEILQELDEEILNSDMKIFVDCHMDSGYDAMKVLALGGDAVSIGRPILRGLLENGHQEVEKIITHANQELCEVMGYTGVTDLSKMHSGILRMK